MDYGSIVSDSIAFTREALTGKWITWLILILCSMPLALIRFIGDPQEIFDGKTIHWELVPWPELIALCLLGFVLSFVIFGYIVRIYRGVTPPPVLDAWGSLFVDGIKLVIVCLLWILPGLVIMGTGLIFLVISFAEIPTAPTPLFSAGFSLFFIGLIILAISALYSNLGIVRFARTGSIREGFRFSALTRAIQAIGWGNYLFALVICVLLFLVCDLLSVLLQMIPVVGWVIPPVLLPVYQVFFARYLCRVYDHGELPAPVPAPVLAQ